jgi:hypothetical protein
MSMPSVSPSAPAKTELETVVNWPMLVTAAGLGFLLVAVPLVLACVAALKGDAVKDEAARPASPALEPVHVAPVAAPVHPIASYEPKEVATPLPVYREAVRPPIKFDPVPVRIAAAPPPALDPVLQFPYVAEPPPFKRLDTLSEDALCEMLAKHAKEVDLESIKGTRQKLLEKARAGRTDKKSPSPILALWAERADLEGLPMIGEENCQAGPETTKKMQVISQGLRRLLDVRTRSSRSVDHYSALDIQTLLTKQESWLQDDGLSTLMQMIQVENPLSRHELVKRLATVKSARASVFLARAALFDLSADVREQAIKGLKDRPREEYRQVLLDGFRYPWSLVAAHAAEAVVALDDRAAALDLANLLDAPDPCEPVLNRGKWVVREVVRINHLRNCLLCHAPSTARSDPLRGVVPVAGEPLPRAYYTSSRGDFVRADITYLRQDFSVTERVAKPDKWPEWQRFDYLVRTRELTADEVAAHRKKPRKSPFASYPQRYAVRFALRELTGLDAGEESADWQDILCAMEEP